MFPYVYFVLKNTNYYKRALFFQSKNSTGNQSDNRRKFFIFLLKDNNDKEFLIAKGIIFHISIVLFRVE